MIPQAPNTGNGADADASVGNATIRGIGRNLMPLLALLYIASFVDRVNIGYVAASLKADLGIRAAQFGLVSGLFFIGYFIFEVPSNLLMRRFGARRWIARIVFSWGLLAFATGLVSNFFELCALRLLLGIAEAGFFPGIILYLTYWFPREHRARAVSLFMLALPVATVISAPVSGWIIDHAHWWGLPSWRWMFLIEGFVTLAMTPLVIGFLPDTPRDCAWLTDDEKKRLATQLEEENRQTEAAHGTGSWRAPLTNPRVLAMALIYFAKSAGVYSLAFFTPTIIRSLGTSTTATRAGFIQAIPYALAAAAMVLWARHSDRTGERRLHIALPYLVGAACLLALNLPHDDPWLSLALLSLVTVCMYIPYGPFWSLPSMFLTGDAAASGMAWINSLASLGGFVGPFVIGALNEATGTVFTGLGVVGGILFGAAILTIRLPRVKTEAGHSTP